MDGQATRRSRVLTVIRVSSGNFLEMYDFFVFGYYSVFIGRIFFPAGSAFASLMLALMTFGAGFLMRPVGAIVLGAYVDRKGRRAGLLLSLAFMSAGTFSIAFTPGYASIGLLAPALVVAGRLLQGFSAGVEMGVVSVYLAEIAPPGRTGFYVSWQTASQSVAVVLVALLGVLLSTLLPPEAMGRWGWRIPLMIGCLIIPFIFLLRRGLLETETFLRRAARPTAAQSWRIMLKHWRLMILGILTVTMGSVSFYFITAYTPTFGRAVLHLGSSGNLIVTLCVGLSNLFWLPVMAAVSDRIGRRPVLVGSTTLAILTAYPTLLWLVSAPSFERLLLVELWLSFVYGSYSGAMVVHLAEIVPLEVRTASFSLAYSLATALFGGFTPAIATYLIHISDNRAVPGLWLSFAAACGLAAALLTTRRRPARAVRQVLSPE